MRGPRLQVRIFAGLVALSITSCYALSTCLGPARAGGPHFGAEQGGSQLGVFQHQVPAPFGNSTLSTVTLGGQSPGNVTQHQVQTCSGPWPRDAIFAPPSFPWSTQPSPPDPAKMQDCQAMVSAGPTSQTRELLQQQQRRPPEDPPPMPTLPAPEPQSNGGHLRLAKHALRIWSLGLLAVTACVLLFKDRQHAPSTATVTALPPPQPSAYRRAVAWLSRRYCRLNNRHRAARKKTRASLRYLPRWRLDGLYCPRALPLFDTWSPPASRTPQAWRSRQARRRVWQQRLQGLLRRFGKASPQDKHRSPQAEHTFNSRVRLSFPSTLPATHRSSLQDTIMSRKLIETLLRAAGIHPNPGERVDKATAQHTVHESSTEQAPHTGGDARSLRQGADAYLLNSLNNDSAASHTCDHRHDLQGQTAPVPKVTAVLPLPSLPMYMPLRGRPQSPPLGAAIRGPRVWVQGGTADLPTPAPPPEFKQTPQEEANIAIIKKAHATSLDPAKRAATPGESHDTPLLNAYYSAGQRANLGLFNGRPSQNNAAGATLVPVQLSLMAASVDCQYRNRPATLGGKASIIYSSPAPAAKAFAAAAEAVAPGCLQSMEPMTAVTTAVGSGTLAQTFQTILYIFASHLTLFLLLSQQKGAATTGFPIVQPSADGTGVAVLTDGSPLLQIVAPQMEKSLLTACTVRINFTLAETTMPAGLTSGGRLRFALRSWLSSFLQYRSTAAVPAAKSGSPQWYKTIEQLLLLPELQLLDLLAVADVPGGSGNIADLQFYNPATAAALRAAGAAGLLDDRAGFMTVLLTVVGGGATLLWGILLRGFILPPLAPLLLTLLRELDVFIRSGAAVLQSVLRMEKGAASGLEVQDPRYATAGGRVGTMAELLEWVGGASAAFFSTSGGSLSGVQMAVPVSFLPGDIGTMLAFLAACAARRKPFIVTGMHLSACVARFCSIGGSDALFSLGDQVKQLHGLHTALASMQAIVAVHDGKPLLYVAERMRGPLVDLPVPVRPVLRVKPDRRDQAAGAAWHAERSEVMHVFEEQVKVHAAAQLAATTLHRKVTLTAEYKATLLSAAEVALRPEPPPLQQPAAAAGSPGSPGGLSMFWALLDEASVSGVEDPEARAAAARTAAALADAGREADALKRALAQQTLSSPARPPPARREGQSGAVDTNGPASMLSSPEAALPST